MTLEQAQQRWHELARAALSDGAIELGTLLAGSRLQSLAAGVATILLAGPCSEASRAQLPRYRARLGLAEAELRLVVEQGKGSVLTPATQAQRHPLVKQLEQRFDGSVAAVEPMSRADWLARLERLQ